jgi:apolipoprotein N-acyltransferase
MLFCGACAWLIARKRTLYVGAGLVALAGIALWLPLDPAPSELTDHSVRIVQPNAPQDEKWDPDLAHIFVERQMALTAEGSAPDLVVWPEMAIPYRASVAGIIFEQAALSARGAPVVMGVTRDLPDGRVFNAALLIGPDGTASQFYDKHHLVPFGEYMPFPEFFRSLGIRALAERTRAGYSRGTGPATLDLGAIGPALMLICYEAVFPQDTRTPNRPALVIQITNDAWFGQTLGPQQHLALARMRAIELGLPVVRAANTGISAMIDPRGRVLQSLALNTAGALDAPLPQPLAPTLYSQTGDGPVTILIIVALLVLILRRAIDQRRAGA